MTSAPSGDIPPRIGFRDRRPAKPQLPLPFSASLPYIALAARKDGYGDKWSSE